MNAEDLIALNEEIAAMARAGLPLDQGLAALAREMGGGRLRQLTAELADDLRAGHTLPQALERRGNRVPPFYAALLAAGVRSGRLVEVLTTLTTYARSLADLRATILSAAFYPGVVLVFGFVLFGFLCFYIVPQFEVIFRDFNMSLPIVTEAVLALGRHPLELVVLPLVVVVGTLFATRFVLRRTPTGRLLWARFVYAIPLVGTLLRATRMAAFTELLAILVDHEVPLPEALRLAGEASSEPIMADAVHTLRQDLEQGQPLSKALKKQKAVPELISWMTGLGEQRGALGNALHQVAEMYRRQAGLRATLLHSLLPPFLLISTAGVLVVLFVLAIMMPMFKLLEGLSK
jgi:type II secretory pathway component PulF